MLVDVDHYVSHVNRLCQIHEQAMADLDCDVVAIYAGSPKIAFLDDYHFPFKANPHFLWWLPLEQNPESWIVFRPGEKPHLIYHQPADYWHLPPADPAGYWTDSFEITVSSSDEQARAELPKDLSRVAVIGENPPDWGFGHVNHQQLIDRLHWQRAAKTEYEVTLMRQASLSGAAAHLAAAQAFADGDSEYDIHLKYMAA